jgi:hypothetical protein
MTMPTKRTTHIDSKMTEILREAKQKDKYSSLFVIILGGVLLLCDLFDVFILHFLENVLGVEHKYKSNTNSAKIYESLLLEKYPFCCWTPFDEKSVTAHLAIYLYTVIPVLMIAFKAGSVLAVLAGTITYVSLQFKFVSKSLEDLSTVEDSDSLIEQNTFTSPDKQHTCEESNCRKCQFSATDDEAFQTPNQAQIPECCNKHKDRDTNITTAQCVKDQEHTTDSYRIPSGNKSSPEDCVITIIKNHQEAIR